MENLPPLSTLAEEYSKKQFEDGFLFNSKNLNQVYSSPFTDVSNYHQSRGSLFTDVLNYHRSVHLFYQDWLDNSYGKVNFTEKQKAYFNTLQPQTNVNYPPGLFPEIRIFSLTNSNQDVDSMWSRIMSMFDGFHDRLSSYMDQPAVMQRYRRDAGNKADMIKARQEMRRKLKAEGGAVWRRYILQQRLNRLQRGKGDWSSEVRQKKINMLAKLIKRIDRIHPELSEPVGPPSEKYEEPPINPIIAAPPAPGKVLAPPVPKFTEKRPSENIPTQDPNDDQFNNPPPTPATNAPPVNKPVAAPPQSINEEGDEDGDGFDPFNEQIEEDFTGHFPNRKDIDTIFGRRKRRDVGSEARYTQQQIREFSSAVERLRTSQMSGLSEYDMFVMSHRFTEAPQAYSHPRVWNRQFLNRFESALHQYNPTVQIPYLDMCSLLQQPDVDKLSLWSELLNTPVIPDCAWIGHSLQRKVVPSAVIIDRLNTTLGCARGSVAQLGMDQFADIHSLFGPCEAGGSHLACPSCAVSDPLFWIIYADLDRRMGSSLVQ